MRGIEILISHLGQGLRSLFLLILLYSERTVHFGIVQMYNYSVEFLSLFFFRRKTLFYTVVLILPTVLMAFLNVTVFYLPTASGSFERIFVQ